MITIYKRVGGAPLTKTQLDNNFSNLNNYTLDMTSPTGFAILPSGTQEQRPASASVGMVRYNTTINDFEGFYSDTGWDVLGARGYTGSTPPSKVGQTGPTGPTGFTGYSGSVGATGNPGFITTGYTGSKGVKGDKGGTGPRGDGGIDGDDGIMGISGPIGLSGTLDPLIVYTGTNTSAPYNNTAITINTTSTAPSYNNGITVTGIAFRSNGSIYISRNNSSTAQPQYAGVVYVSANINSNLVLHKYNNNSVDVVKAYFNGGDNSLTYMCGGDATLQILNQASDHRLKENIVECKHNNIELLKKIKLYDFNFKDNKIKELGYIAHQLQEILPNSVIGEKDEIDEDGSPKYQTILTLSYINFLFACVKELDHRLNKIKNKGR